jgi:muramidase (phage lysozyme)
VTVAKNLKKNVGPFLDMLARGGEGTDIPNQPSKMHGYDVIVGGGTFDCFDDHPRKVVVIKQRNGKEIRSSAAGRYQFIRSTWDALAKKLKLADFGPVSQDLAAQELLIECGAAALLAHGKFDDAVHAARKIWASLPGAGYGQREESLWKLRDIYVKAGGTL